MTPHLVDAMSCDQAPKTLPGEETRSPDDFELFLEGILEAPRGPSGSLAQTIAMCRPSRMGRLPPCFPVPQAAASAAGGQGCPSCPVPAVIPAAIPEIKPVPAEPSKPAPRKAASPKHKRTRHRQTRARMQPTAAATRCQSSGQGVRRRPRKARPRRCRPFWSRRPVRDWRARNDADGWGADGQPSGCGRESSTLSTDAWFLTVFGGVHEGRATRRHCGSVGRDARAASQPAPGGRIRLARSRVLALRVLLGRGPPVQPGRGGRRPGRRPEQGPAADRAAGAANARTCRSWPSAAAATASRSCRPCAAGPGNS